MASSGVSPAPMSSASPEIGLQVFLLGPPLVQWAGQPLTIPRRHVRGFFYYLAARRKPVSRDQLCLLFWPDISDIEARRNLTRLLTHLRQALPVTELLAAESDQISLDTNQYSCDVWEFERLAGVQPETMATFLAATTLYRGPFLEGFDLTGRLEYERWLLQERASLERLYLKALASLTGIYTARQDYSNAIQTAQRYLEADELAEEMHQRLISLYGLAGDRTRALRQFEACVAILERELGTDPLEDTRALYQAVLDGSMPALPCERLEFVQPAGWERLRLDIPLLGRASVLQRLEEAFQRAQAGHSNAVLISGEPGIGKSRLLHDFAARCWPDSRVLFGSGQPGTQSVPYHPIVEALRPKVVAVRVSLPPIWLAEIARLIPEINGIYTDLPKPLPIKGEEARVRLFESLCRFLFALQSKTGPILLCLDDLHWFDPTSLSWLSYLCREFPGKSNQVMILGSYRLEEENKIKELHDSLERFGLLQEIPMHGLDDAQIHKLLQFLIGDLPGIESFAGRLQAATGGNPFYLIETLGALREENRLGVDLAKLIDFPFPESVREVINRRLAWLDPRSRQILEAGAVLGSNFGFQEVYLTAGRNDLETVGGLDELVNRQFLVEEGEDYRFSHDLIRRTAVAAVSPMRLRLLHSRAGKALEKLGSTKHVALAVHFDHGGDWEKAFQYTMLSSGEAEALFGWQEAETHLERALELLKRIDRRSTQQGWLARHVEILEKLAHLHSLQGRMMERDADLKQIEALVASCNDPHLRLRSIVLHTQYLNADGNYQKAIAEAEQGLPLAETLKDWPARFRLLVQTGLSYTVLGQPVQALSALEQAEAMGSISIGLELRANVLGRLARIHSQSGDYQKALGYLEKAVACLEKVGEHYRSAQWQVEIGFLYTNLGRFQEAGQSLIGLLAFFRKLGTLPDEAHTLIALGGLHTYEGDYAGAMRCYAEALEVQQQLRMPHLTASIETSLGLACYHLGDLVQSRTWLERGLERARSIGFRMGVAEALIDLAMLELRAENPSAAHDKLQEGLALAREIHNEDLQAAGMAAEARLERQSGAPARALELALEASSLAQRLGLATGEMWARTEAGLAHLDLGELDGAEADLHQAVLLVERAHQGWIGTEQVLLAYARVLEQTGKTVHAEEQRRLADAVLQAKAALILDASQRQVFLSQARR
jgi:DNA-binding SARP family transcriptional activator